MPARVRTSAFVILILGAWGALVPFVGPLFGYRMGGTPAWMWTESHVTLHLIPGIVAAIGGALMLRSVRSSVRLGAVLGSLGGAWFILAPTFHPAWAGGGGGGSMMMGGVWNQIASALGYHYGIGVAILAVAMYALGALAAHSRHRDAETAMVDQRHDAFSSGAGERAGVRVS
ncbi:hypothetical protein SAMN05661080_03880 [Modestobacter sp. DSM 44400]|uniref:hypothetical protein n=1 Tax=Modestobacter sp. DSM 44400 TaxID=1550230 RepID=UPI000895BF21|nr:hypothetical protein [Modestobacter sp. DSM 44400]SDY56615.1 hypothetical protein SAMN05661080_03880 [Modestobacter sp. DSM 44400]